MQVPCVLVRIVIYEALMIHSERKYEVTELFVSLKSNKDLKTLVL